MPKFQVISCPKDIDVSRCLEVTFSNGIVDRLILKSLSKKSSVFEGYLANETDASVVMIENPEENLLVRAIFMKIR